MVLRDMSGRITLAAVALLLALPVSALGQARLTGADLGGNVIDQTEALVPAARITVTNVDTNIARTVVTDDKGHYDVPALPTRHLHRQRGARRLHDPDARGRGPVARPIRDHRFQVDAGDGPGIGHRRSRGPAGAGESHRAVVGREPAADRAACRSTAATSSASPSSRPACPPTARRSRAPRRRPGCRSPGSARRSNNIMVDGLDNNDPVVGAVRATFSQEAVREFQVLTRFLLGGVRQGRRRRRQHRDQERHQRASRQRLLLLPRREPEREGLLREVRHVRQSRRISRRRRSRQTAVGRRRSAAHRARTGLLLPVLRERTDISRQPARHDRSRRRPRC